MKKRKKWPWIVLAVVAVVIILIIILLSSAANELGKTVYTRYDVKKGDVSTTITASGTLRAQDTAEIDLPDGIEVEEVLVSLGDRVSKGDRLAKVNISGAKEVASQLQDSLETIDSQISMSNSSSGSTAVKSGVKGRIKAIYAKEGDLASSVISEYGSLAVISMDGKMYVDISTQKELNVGDELQIRWSDSTQTAQVLYAIDGGYRVTFDDDSVPYDESVAVYLDDEHIADATAQISSPATVYTDGGRITGIEAEVNESVSASTTIFTIEEGQQSSSYLQLISQREQIAEDLSVAAALVDEPYLKASADGVISQINAGSAASSAVSQPNANTASAASSYAMGSGMSQLTSGTSSAGSASLDGSQTASNAAFVIETGSVNKMTVSVNELDISNVKVGQEAQVTIDAFSDETFEAEVTSVSNYGEYDGSMSNYSVELTINDDERLLSGMNGSAVIVSNSVEDVLIIPVEAISEDSQGAFVYVSETGNTDGSDNQEVRIKTGLSDGQYVEVTEGLSENDKVMYVRSGTTMYEQLMSMREEMMGEGSAQ